MYIYNKALDEEDIKQILKEKEKISKKLKSINHKKLEKSIIEEETSLKVLVEKINLENTNQNDEIFNEIEKLK